MKLRRYLTPLSAWAMSFGCAVGWGAFIMPGTTFLPVAGPLGTLVGLCIGAAVMFLIGRNYHYLIQHFPESGGAYCYVRRICGNDHGYICGWFLILTYVAIAWANATALALIGRNLMGGFFSFGFRYTVVGFEVYAGEIMLSVLVVAAIWAVFVRGKQLAANLQTVLSLVLLVGIAICFVAVFARHEGGLASLTPAFSDKGDRALQVVGIIALAPWAFVGFESISHSAEEFSFPRWRTVGIIISSLVAAALAYIALAFMAASTFPEGFSGWREYTASLGSLNGIEAVPAFHSVNSALGTTGLAVLCMATFAAIVTGLVGNTVAASRLLYAMSRDGLLPEFFSKLDKDYSPRNAILVVLASTCLVPFVGRTVIGWIVDITTIGASIAYGYVSYCTFRVAKDEDRRFVMASGIAGLVVSLLFIVYFLVPNFWVVEALSTQAYFFLAIWSIVGVLVFRSVFHRDHSGRIGSSTAAWIVLVFFVFFSGHMWDRQMTRDLTNLAVTEIHEHFDVMNSPDHDDEECDFLERQKDRIDDTLTHYNLIQVALVVIALGIMYNIYTIISRREHQAAKAKAYFFSTISHDVRTPLNAIVGFSQMLKLGFKTKKESDDAVDSILVSSKALLGLINDILDLSKLESGRMNIEPEPTDVPKLVREIAASFGVTHQKSGFEILCHAGQMPALMLDPYRLRQIAFNLVGNAVKFTQKGFVDIRASFEPGENPSVGVFRMEVQDTGCGISAEDQKKLSIPFAQVCSGAVRRSGTGLGLHICRLLAKAMGGDMKLVSAPGKGTTISIVLPGVRLAPEAAHEAEKPQANLPGSGFRILVADDAKLDQMVLKTMFSRLGVADVTIASDGREALEVLKTRGASAFDLVLTDMWMPEMDGAELVAAIRADPELAKVRVYLFTAEVEMKSAYAKRGFDGVLLKPASIGDLRALLGGIGPTCPRQSS